VTGFWVLVLALAVLGVAAAAALWRRLDGDAALQDTTPLELCAAGAILGFSFWIAVNWALALMHLLTRTALFTAALTVVAAALIIVAIRLRSSALPRLPMPSSVWLLALVPIGAWLLYVLWRGAVLPPDSHDALAYHLPKAVFMARAHGYGYFAAPDPRIPTFPANYELLLSDLLLMTHGDRITEWIAAVTWILFLLAAAAVFERWWGRGVHVAVAILVTASTPVLLLHSGADKNDLMTCGFAVAALLWAGRWVVRGGSMPWVLLILALVCGAGTKPQQAAILIGIAPFLLVALVRFIRMRAVGWKWIGGTVALCVVAFTLCGGAAYVVDAIHNHGSIAPAQVNGLQNSGAAMYGDWNNLWQFPYLLLTEPFSTDPLTVWVPWRHERWYWPKYELYFSNYGVLFTILVCALPLCIWRYRTAAAPAVRHERLVFGIGAAIAFLLILPVVFRPLGFFFGSGRYTVFVIPAVIGWTVAPAVRRLRQVRPRAVVLLTAGLALLFVLTAADLAVNDRFSPFQYAVLASRKPNTRWIWFSNWRAATVIDQVAGPNDTIAVDGGFDTWLYPAMGAHQTRPIVFIPHGPGAVRIPPQAQWVMIDRAWHRLWGHPEFTDFGRLRTYLARGRPTADDVRVFEALLHDPRYELVYYNSRFVQAVFRRRRAGSSG